MAIVRSADGTTIGYDVSGEGPPIITVVGAFNDRGTAAPLAAALQDRFRVFTYDRRGRGESSDTAPYSLEREVEDLDALIGEAGGSAFVFGYSSGATLALHAAAHGLSIRKLALYEPPFVIDDSRPRPPADLADRLAELIWAGRRGDAVELYQTAGVGLPQDVVVQMRQAPFRPALEQIAHTLVYDALIIGDLSLPTELLASVTTPTLMIDGGESWSFLRTGVRAAAEALPNGSYRSLPGETHHINPEPTAAAVAEFFAD